MIALRIAHNAAIACGVGHVESEQSQTIGSRCAFAHARDQSLERVGLGKGHIARQHHHQTVVDQFRHRLLHGMASAQLGFLPHKFDGQITRCFGYGSFNFCCAVARDHHRRTCFQLGRCAQHMT